MHCCWGRDPGVFLMLCEREVQDVSNNFSLKWLWGLEAQYFIELAELVGVGKAKISCTGCTWTSSPPSFLFLLPEVTKILLFAAQASHQLVPPEVSIPLTFGDVKMDSVQASSVKCMDWGQGIWSDPFSWKPCGNFCSHWQFLQVPGCCFFIKGYNPNAPGLQFLQENLSRSYLQATVLSHELCLSVKRALLISCNRVTIILNK